jgi:hypothetical protein
MTIEQRLRNPTLAETKLLERLLREDFPGRKEITKQLEKCLVRTIDNEGSLELKPSEGAESAAVEKRIPVEAEGADTDGVHVHFLLHVVSGYVRELEVYKDDASPIKRMPKPADLQVVVLPA